MTKANAARPGRAEILMTEGFSTIPKNPDPGSPEFSLNF
jgi:hypothetical protein